MTDTATKLSTYLDIQFELTAPAIQEMFGDRDPSLPRKFEWFMNLQVHLEDRIVQRVAEANAILQGFTDRDGAPEALGHLRPLCVSDEVVTEDYALSLKVKMFTNDSSRDELHQIRFVADLLDVLREEICGVLADPFGDEERAEQEVRNAALRRTSELSGIPVDQLEMLGLIGWRLVVNAGQPVADPVLPGEKPRARLRDFFTRP